MLRDGLCVALFCEVPSVPFCLDCATVFLITATDSAAKVPHCVVFGY